MELDVLAKKKSSVENTTTEEKLVVKKTEESLLREVVAILNSASLKKSAWKFQLAFYLGCIAFTALVVAAFVTTDVITGKLFVSLAILLSLGIVKRFS